MATFTMKEREKRRQRMVGNKMWVDRKHSLGSREKMRRSWRRGNRFSAEARMKMRESAIKRGGRRHNPAAKEKMRQAALSRKHSPETREKIRQARLRQRLPTKMTSIELSLHSQFRKRRLKFEMHKTMFGRFQPDFVFEGVKLIVQADGYYWHNRENRRWDDRRFSEAAQEAAWTVWRFAESEIKMHPEACGRAVARFIRSHN